MTWVWMFLRAIFVRKRAEEWNDEFFEDYP
jgi:hypothetical protein